MGKKKRPYSDWFGNGDTFKDIEAAVKEHGQPERVFLQRDGYMAALVYPNKVVVVGYDGNEYKHEFCMDEPHG